MIRVYDHAGNAIETHEHAGDFKEPWQLYRSFRTTCGADLLNCRYERSAGVGRSLGDGRDLGVGVGRGVVVALGVGVEVGVGVAGGVAVAVAVGVAVAVTVAVALGVNVAVGVGVNVAVGVGVNVAVAVGVGVGVGDDAPPFVVRRIIPPSPATIPVNASLTKKASLRFADVPLVWSVQVIPVSVVWRILPPEPTANPLTVMGKATPSSA